MTDSVGGGKDLALAFFGLQRRPMLAQRPVE